jgi:hypothetical protein
MKVRLIACAAAAVVAVWVCPPQPAHGQPQIPTGPQIFRRFGRLTSMNEPTRSAMLPLLTRPDVQSSLELDMKQKREL